MYPILPVLVANNKAKLKRHVAVCVSKIRLPSWNEANRGDQRYSCLKNAGRFIQSSRADNAHEAGDRSLSAYLMLVQQRRRVCVEAHIDCHPCRHPSPLLHRRTPCTAPFRSLCCIERATTFHVYGRTEAWCNEVCEPGIPATSYCYVSRRY